jgi:Tol biopolymer transport system component
VVSNAGNNISPQLCANGDIIFCTDYQLKQPGIGVYRCATGKVELLVNDGYCASPSLCERTGKLVYCKQVKGFMQLFVADLARNRHEQITFDTSNKEECSWSPCGNYIAFAVSTPNTNRIALLCAQTKEQIFLTRTDEYCTYPAWSGYYGVPISLA